MRKEIKLPLIWIILLIVFLFFAFIFLLYTVREYSSSKIKPLFKISSRKSNLFIEDFDVYRNRIKESKNTSANKSIGNGPYIAIVIDDLYELNDNFLKLLNFPYKITIAVIPPENEKDKEEIQSLVEIAYKYGFDIILHQPMEALDSRGIDMGTRAIFTYQSDELIMDILRKNLDMIPFIIGMNNHMGSKATEDERVLRDICHVLKKRDLFFLDSYTIAKSRVFKVCNALGVPYARRSIFLDNIDSYTSIEEKMKELISIAETRGYAIGIGHITKENTVNVILDSIMDFQEKKITLTGIPELIKMGYSQNFPADTKEVH